MKRIGVLGGSFNPVHTGHVALGVNSLDAFSLDTLVVVPSGTHPFKGDAEISAEHRFVMTKLAFKDYARVFVSDIELGTVGINYSIDTLARLKEQYPEDQLVFIQGADIAGELHKWHRAEDLYKYCSFAFVNRRGYSEEKLLGDIARLRESLNLQIQFSDMDLPEVSSTELRYMLSKGVDCSYLVPADVLFYIREWGLYR